MKNAATTYNSPVFKIITFEPRFEEDTVRAQQEIETLMAQGWVLIRVTAQPGTQSIVLFEYPMK